MSWIMDPSGRSSLYKHTHAQPSGDEVKQINAGLYKPSAIVPVAGVIFTGINPKDPSVWRQPSHKEEKKRKNREMRVSQQSDSPHLREGNTPV